jgi:hypothetical protein
VITCRVPGCWSIDKAEMVIRSIPQGDRYMVVTLTAMVPLPAQLMDDLGQAFSCESYCYVSYSEN